MSVNIKIDTISLDNHIYWENRYSYSRDKIDIEYSVWGIPIIYQGRRLSEIGGNIITLESHDDSGWQQIQTAKSIKTYSNRIDVGEYFTFTYYDKYYECMFYSDEGQYAVDWKPVNRNATLDTDWCLLTINLVITQLKIGVNQ